MITLTSDFGYKDPFVGIMKGVIASINPQALTIDLCHGIAPQDIIGAALILRHSINYFPRGTIHVAVIDPGVGSARRPILIESAGSYFIGPDNGVLSWAVARQEPTRIIHLSNTAYQCQPLSATFHGRDVFAPAAAHLSLGVDVTAFGDALQDFIQIPWPVVARLPHGLQGEIIYIDHFGNLFTNITMNDLKALPGEKLVIGVGDVFIEGLADNYAGSEGTGRCVAVINSWGLLEIALYRGSAQRHCGAQTGDHVRIRAY